ncbi:efflux transporter, outer membrane factor (OMF) lipoprotein, NodT family [Collimonas sp. OK607]|uniref:efflux transporter outer membrane subunit n=1 Tax=Collimonas sp. OK607 TaxID=1798194 RepID=UPI0008EDF611|nr:efflux transporter outer membrane subunit [Collimonas sp. OK607]SFA77289.1 efflux transporter, outer membrane factor (OMF) lipoprotein, NodT family [Collimonas sp. OK607]
MNSHPSSVRRSLPKLGTQRLAISAAALLLAACANFSGIHSTAHSNSPDDYASTSSLPGQGGMWPATSWVSNIGGSQLQQLVDEALASNPNLQAAAARIAASRAMVEAAGATGKPQVGASLSATRERFSENSIYPPPFGGMYVTDYETALNFSYDLDFWGKHGAQLSSAVSQSKAAEAEHYAARLALTAGISKAWLQLGRQYAQLDLTNQQLALRDKLDKLTQQRFAAGLDTQTDNQQSRQQVANLRAEQSQWQEAIALTRNQIAALMGQGPDRGLKIPVPTLPADSSIALPDQLPLGLLGRRPDVVAARWQVEAAQSDIKVAKTEFYPNVNLSAMAGFSSLGFSQFLTHGSKVVGIGPAIHLPIFEGGALRAQLKGRVAAYDGAVATYNQALNDAFHEVADSVQSLRAAETQDKSQQAAVDAAERGMKLAEQRQQVGTGNMLQVVSTQIGWLAQRKTELDVRARRADLRVNLIRSLGGGFDATAEGLNPAEANASSAATPQASTAN